MKEAHNIKYCQIMEEIKSRTNSIDYFLKGAGHASYRPATVETVSLQFRKILELIAMSSLAANKDIYSKVYKDFAKSWNAKFLIRDLERVNPKFYPKPMEFMKSKEAGVKFHLDNTTKDFLQKGEFIKIYDKCGAALHSDNPFGSKTNYKYYEDNFIVWRNKIVNLLKIHLVRMLDDDIVYLIFMDKDEEGKVRSYTLESTLKP